MAALSIKPNITDASVAVSDAFFTTKPVGVGTGLGLAICQRLVTDMGGDLTVESTSKNRSIR